MTEKPITISATTLALFNDCKRCFWLQVRQKIRRPSGPFPALPGGIDRVLKKYFDDYRVQGLPPELEGKVDAKLFPDQVKINNWRMWQRGLAYYDKNLNAQFVSALDDLLVDVDGKYVPFDFKTKGAQVKDGAEIYNQLQMSAYSFLLQANRMETSGYGILMYLWPKEVLKNWVIPFEIELRRVQTYPDEIKKQFKQAVSFLHGPPPSHVEDCAFCQWNLMK